MRVKTTSVTLTAYSIVGLLLPTFQQARLKTVYNKWGCKVARYLFFTYIDHKILSYSDSIVYGIGYIRVK